MKKTVILGLLIILLAFSFFGCGDDDNDPPPVTKISIISITEKTGVASIMLYSSFTLSSDPVAGGQGTISNNSLNDIPMQTTSGSGWNGQAAGGSYMIFLVFSDMSMYAYTGGSTFETLQINTFDDLNTKLPKLDVGLGSMLNFSNFKDIAEFN